MPDWAKTSKTNSFIIPVICDTYLIVILGNFNFSVDSSVLWHGIVSSAPVLQRLSDSRGLRFPLILLCPTLKIEQPYWDDLPGVRVHSMLFLSDKDQMERLDEKVNILRGISISISLHWIVSLWQNELKVSLGDLNTSFTSPRNHNPLTAFFVDF